MLDCNFDECNFTMAQIKNTGFNNVSYISCKLMGLDFSKCNSALFSVSFNNSNLDYTSFTKKKMKKTNFLNCSLKQSDFEEADLSQAIFENCNLQDTNFMRCILEKTDFRTAKNITLDPEQNRMKQAKFSVDGALSLLRKYKIEVE